MLDRLSQQVLIIETRSQVVDSKEDTNTLVGPHLDTIKCMLMRIKKKSKNSNGGSSLSWFYSYKDKWLNKTLLRISIRGKPI
jgi:hypothetical protein